MSLPEAEIEVLNVQECPETNFRHIDKCPIDTCQFNTCVTETGCLARDRYETSNKTMSDAEMYLYKLPDALNIRQVSTRRKTAIKKVKNLIFLSFFIFYIKDNYKPESGLPYRRGVSSRIDSIVDSYPFKLKMLKFEPWVLKFLVNEKIYKRYIKKEVSNLSTDINLKNMLNLTPKKLLHLQKDIKRMCKKNKTGQV